MSEINVVPYIDVMLVLLVIFMIAAPLLSQGVRVELPRVSSTPLPPSEQEPIIVSVNAAGEYYINYGENQDRPIAPQQLLHRARALLSHQPGTPFYVRGDAAVPYARVVELMALLQSAGVPGVGLMTEPPEPPP